MNKLQSAGLSLLAVSLTWGSSVLAEEQTKATPVEFFACNYMKGKGLEDVQKVGMDFSKWAAKNDMNYAAWLLTPQFHAADLGFDLGWLGAWSDGNAFGKGQEAWMSEGGEIAARFAKVMDCSISHEMASSVPISAPAAPPGDGVVMFSECSLKEGKTLGDSYMAHKKLGADMKAMGAKTSSWLFYPSLGAAIGASQYWSVISAQNYSQLGAAWEMYTNGGGWQKRQEALGDIVSCASPAVFDAHVVVTPAAS
jgi:hypothetical protein